MAKQARYLRSPTFVWWDITYHCNLHCKQCYSDAGENKVEELDTQEVKQVIRQLKDCQTFYIYFLGGEPFLRPDFLEILDHCHTLNIGVMISTNGWYVTREVAKKVARANVSLVRVSIDGAKAETHDAIRGKQGSFRKAWRAVSLLKAETIPTVGISLTVMEDNLHEVDNLVELAIREGVRELQLVQLCRTGRGVQARGLTLEHWLELRKLLREKATHYKKHLRFSATEGLWEKPATTTFRQQGKTPLMMGCTAGRASVSISADGKVMPCIQYRKTAGNLRHQSFMDIWQKSPVLQERRVIHPECTPCQFCVICTRECPVDPVSELKEYRRKCFQQQGSPPGDHLQNVCLTNLSLDPF